MTWTLIGWLVIGIAAVLLAAFWILFRTHDFYAIRYSAAIQSLQCAQSGAIERGRSRQLVLGNQLNGWTYPGLGLHALACLPGFLSQESVVEGGLSVASGDGELVVFARQIARQYYQQGFSLGLHQVGVQTMLPGPTPWSLTAGLLSTHPQNNSGSTALLGYFGAEALLWSEAALGNGGDVFSAGGTLAGQSVLFLNVRDLLIGERVFLMPGKPGVNRLSLAGWLTEDVLRLFLIVGLVVGAILKMVGVL